MKVLFLTNVPSPYRVDFFNEFGKKCDLTVLFEKSTSSERDDSWKNYVFKNFKGYVLKGKSVKKDSAITFGMLKYLRDKSFDKIICSNFSTLSGIIAIEYMRLIGREYYIESDGGFAKTGDGWKEKLKKHIVSGAKGYFSTADEHDKYYLRYGAEKEKIFRYPFTSLKKQDILNRIITVEEKDKLRKKLGICEKKVLLAVGQFVYRKGFDVLLNAAAELPKSVGIYFIGGAPTDEYIELKNKLGLSNVHFIGFKLKEELKEYYKASDIFVLPTREDIWGLVINEAMANGLPLVTTNRCIAGLQLVKDGENGYIVGVDDICALAEKIKNILFVDDIVKMSNKSIDIIKEYTIENMALKHIEILEMS